MNKILKIYLWILIQLEHRLSHFFGFLDSISPLLTGTSKYDAVVTVQLERQLPSSFATEASGPSIFGCKGHHQLDARISLPAIYGRLGDNTDEIVY